MQHPQPSPSMRQIFVLVFSIIATLYLLTEVLSQSIQIALLASWFLIMALGKVNGVSYPRMQHGLIQGISKGMDAILVLMAVGALIGSWMAGGVVPNIIYLGLSIMSPDIFLFAAFIICSVTSVATGTSFGTVGTAGIAMMGIGAGFGLPLPLVAGAAICGAYVGDKLSPLSDTTVMTASLCRVSLVSHIKSMLYVSGPAFLITAILFLFTGFAFDLGGSTSRAEEVMATISEIYPIAWYMLIPALVVVALLIMQMPAVPVILLGALLGVVWAYGFSDKTLTEALTTLYRGNVISTSDSFIGILLNRGGITSMLEVILLVILALGLGGLMEVTGVLATIANRLQHWASTPGRLGVSTILAGVLGNMLGGAAYVALITASTITGKNYQAMGIDRRVLSRNAEAGGTITTPMIPWTDGGVFMATTLGVATGTYLPFLWYHILVLVISVIYAYTNWFSFRDENPGAEQKAVHPQA
ncbi:Na+/H+ antiporter NhaC [Alteromonas aestuariivivens]|uniref:Na+/H+ antiporter NhaC n=1 Tax=Alteromonas aestuariivivens TaxID=1938339 RepID=A0A3D8M7D3_9ALTE|nr:Na+/H+ antiporter NhaC [Alteromonas aestuariivivens]RDV25464.1 Na+/H+ antiporter NhaC [Alteromonas aestuariivivens]